MLFSSLAGLTFAQQAAGVGDWATSDDPWKAYVGLAVSLCPIMSSSLRFSSTASVTRHIFALPLFVTDRNKNKQIDVSFAITFVPSPAPSAPAQPVRRNTSILVPRSPLCSHPVTSHPVQFQEVLEILPEIKQTEYQTLRSSLSASF